MDQREFRQKILIFLVLAILGACFSAWLYSRHTLTGTGRVDGIIGVALGLYICSHPASTLVDMLFYNMIARKPANIHPVSNHKFHFAPASVRIAMPKFILVPIHIDTTNFSYYTLSHLLP